MSIIYCDHAATTKIKPEVLNEMMPYLENKYGNASATYELGKDSSIAINEAREKVANTLECKNKEIYFTSCGSESDNLAIKGYCYANKNKGNHIITSKIEHPAVLNTCKTLERNGYEVTYLDVNEKGLIDLDKLRKNIKPSTILVSIMMANNEIGTIEPITEIGKIAKERNIAFHTDAVQAVGNIPINVEKMNIDMLSMSGHKFYGPKGVGVLYIREGIELERIQDGGHQERDKRAGTENVAGIVGLGKAIEIASNNLESYNKKLKFLRNSFIKVLEENIGKDNFKINGDLDKRLPGNVNITFKSNKENLDLLNKLNGMGIYASGGSACSSMCKKPSHVLTAIGVNPEDVANTVRFTFGDENTIYDVYYIAKCIKSVI